MELKYKTFYFTLVLILILLISTYLPSQNIKSFLTSSDENYQYILMKEYVEFGRLFLLKDYTSLDHENLLHPRQFVTFNNKIVPFNYVGLSIVYAPFYVFFKEYIGVVISTILAIVSFVYLTRIAIYLFGKEVKYYSWLGFISCTPLIYYLNQPFFNISVAITFFIVGTYYLMQFNRTNKFKFLILSILSLSIAIFVRYHFILFVLFVFLIIVKGVNLKSFILNLATFLLGILLVAVLPIICINTELYDNPFTIGLSLIDLVNTYKPTYTSPFENTPLKYLFPSPIIPEYILKNIVRLIVLFNPLLFVISLYGILTYLKDRSQKISRWKLLFSSLFVIYIFVFRGSSFTWRSYDFDYIGFDVAILRYWLLLYIFMSIFFINGIKKIRKANRVLFIVLLISILIISFSDLFVSKEDNLYILRGYLEKQDIFAENIRSYITKFDNPEKVVIYTSFLDKVISPTGLDVATWWNGEYNYNPEKIASSMIKVYEYGRSVYLIKDGKYIDIDELNSILRGREYKLIKVLQYSKWEVFKLTKNQNNEKKEERN